MRHEASWHPLLSPSMPFPLPPFPYKMYRPGLDVLDPRLLFLLPRLNSLSPVALCSYCSYCLGTAASFAIVADTPPVTWPLRPEHHVEPLLSTHRLTDTPHQSLLCHRSARLAIDILGSPELRTRRTEPSP
jgi:hypothetical protein